MGDPTPTPIPAKLARRLAEAADGFRNAKPVFFVAGYNPPYKIKEFFDPNEAAKYIETLPPDEGKFGVFGPYETADEFAKFEIKGIENIKEVKVVISFNDGSKPQEETFVGPIDSIFFNLASLEKFLFPYYCHVFGVDYVKKMRDAVLGSPGVIGAANSVAISRRVQKTLYFAPGSHTSDEDPDPKPKEK